MVLPYLFLAISLVLPKFFIQGGANYGRLEERELSLPVHILDNAMFILFGAYFLYLTAREPRFRINAMAILFLALYGTAAALTPLSAIPVISLYQSIRGICFVVIGLVFVRKMRTSDRDVVFRDFVGITIGVFAFGLLGSLVSAVKLQGIGLGLLTKGMTGSFFSLIGYFCLVLALASKRAVIEKTLICALLCYLALKFNSISSLLAFLLGYLVYLIRKGSYFKFCIFTIGLALGAAGLAITLRSNPSLIFANKSSEEILEGSGRFAVYEFAAQTLLAGEAGLLGVGLGAERVLLEKGDLIWAHTAHNSFLSLSLGLGLLGTLLYAAFTGLWARAIFRASPELRESLLAWFASSLYIYGLTSPSYPGIPGFLIVYAIVLYETMVTLARPKTSLDSRISSPVKTESVGHGPSLQT